MAGPQFLELLIGVRIPAPEFFTDRAKNAKPLVFVRGGYNISMDPEYFRTEEQITLTPGEWQELVTSLQSLVQANTALLQTVSELMAQRSDALAPQTPTHSAPLPSLPFPDPYDLAALNRFFTD